MKPYRRNNDPQSPFYVQFSIDGVKIQYCTGRLTKDEAIVAGLKYKADIKTGKHTATIRKVLDIYEASSLGIKPKSIKSNVNQLKAILAVSGLDENSPVSSLTRDVVVLFQTRRMESATDAGSAAVTANSMLRQARSIFCRRMLPSYDHLNLPDISRFMQHPFLREPRRQYQPPTSDAINALVESAKALKTDSPASYAAFLLEIYCGLRAGECIAARWDWILAGQANAEGKRVHYLCVPANVTKGNGERKLPITQAIYDELNALRLGDYIVPQESFWARERTVARKLSKWLRTRVPGRKTNHELRKMFGAMVATTQGLFFAQRALGHSDPKLTSRVYSGLTMPLQPVSY